MERAKLSHEIEDFEKLLQTLTRLFSSEALLTFPCTGSVSLWRREKWRMVLELHRTFKGMENN